MGVFVLIGNSGANMLNRFLNSVYQRLVNAAANQSPAKQPVPMTGGTNNDFYTRTPAGQVVDPDSARKIATAYRCSNILSDDVGKMPLQTFISRRYGEIERVTPNGALKNIAYRLEVSPNDQEWETPFLFKKRIIQWLLFWGNAYIWAPIERSRPLYILNADSTYPEFDLDGKLWYNTRFPNGKTDDIPAVEIMHLMINPHPYGYVGRSVLTYARESMGRQLGAYETQSTMYSKGLNPGLVVWAKGDTSKDTRKKIRDTYEEAMGGSKNATRMAIFSEEEFSKAEAISLKPVDAQFLETINATDVDIANFFGVPQYKLNAGKQSYESNSQQDLDYLKTTLDPYLVQIEQAAQLKWLSVAEQSIMYFRFNRDVILRTDAKTRGEVLNAAIQNGRMSPNESRAIEDMPSYEGGDRKYMGSNMMPVDQVGNVPPKSNTTTQQFGGFGTTPMRTDGGFPGRLHVNITNNGQDQQKVEVINEMPAPVVNVNVPEQPAPQVTVNNENQPPTVVVNVPEQPTPVVNVTNEVNIPEPPARQIKITKEGNTWKGEAQ